MNLTSSASSFLEFSDHVTDAGRAHVAEDDFGRVVGRLKLQGSIGVNMSPYFLSRLNRLTIATQM